MTVKKKKSKKANPYSLSQVLTNLEGGEGGIIGLHADMGNEKAEAVIAQYVWYIKHPKDPQRISLLETCYAQYKKAESAIKDQLK
jgi:hypothetical protein